MRTGARSTMNMLGVIMNIGAGNDPFPNQFKKFLLMRPMHNICANIKFMNIFTSIF